MFDISYPRVGHQELIPGGVLRAMEASWKQGAFPERTVNFSLLENAYIVEDGLVIEASGHILKGSITQHSPAEIERGYAAFKAAMRDGLPPLRPGTFVLCKKSGARNFGHWLIEMLPKAFLAQLYLFSRTPNYIVPEVEGPMRKVIADSLALLEVDPSVILRTGRQLLRVERLILIEGLTHHGVYMSPLVLNCIDSLSARLPGAGLAKLFVIRKSVSRRLTNEEEILRRAKASGYTLLDPGSLTLAEQIAAFKNAREIVGVIGAEMTNIAFAPRGARIQNIAPAGMPDTFFWFIAGLRGHEYSELRCAQTGPIRGVADWDTDLVLDPVDAYSLFGAGP